ncbi:1-phosphatidylinositol-3-phosphate 5-kinase [Phaffia rhodozyma]|uniref:1-phosphatidylinositol-3-phosphate 5-kinase n=1 Tax=Phaffia rhodozyma TaxID=264483 RepID=A0A0F7SFN8_PHARH|nr:1-phosphatidylinositol-3-phosphate 5-kinase [Phaffia rhodozyma]
MTESEKPQRHVQAQPLPASYATHQSTLIGQTMRSLGLSIKKWKEPILRSVQSIPLDEWADDLAQTSLILTSERDRYRVSRDSQKALGGSTPSASEKGDQEQKIGEEGTDGKGDRHRFIRSIPNYTSYRLPAGLKLASGRGDARPLARKQGELGTSELRNRIRDENPNRSDRALRPERIPMNLESTEDDAVPIIPDEQEDHLPGREGRKKVVLVICVLYEDRACVEPDDGPGEIRWVSEEWVIGSGDGRRPQPAAANDEPRPIVSSDNLRVDDAEIEEMKGKILFCSSGVNPHCFSSSSPEDYHLLGGSLVVRNPIQATELKNQKFRSFLEETLRVAIYTHSMNSLEIPLLKSHGYILDPPLPMPMPYERYTLTSNEALSRSRSIDGLPSSRALIREKEDCNALGRRTWGTFFARKRGRQKNNLLGGFWEAIVGQRAQSPLVRDIQDSDTALTRVESEPTAPSSRGNTLESTKDDQKAQVEESNSAKEKEKKVQLKYTRLADLFRTTVFSTSPAVGPFPVPPIFLHLQETENQLLKTNPPKVESSLFEESDDSDKPSASILKSTSSDKTNHNNSTYNNRWGEKAPEGLRLSAEARSGLSAFSGINLTDCSENNGDFGPDGFWKQQTIVVLYAVGLRAAPNISTYSNRQPTDPLTPTLSSTTSDQPECKPPSLIHLPYSATTSPVLGNHPSLGGFIRATSDRASKGQNCDGAGCGKPEIDHVKVWIHGGVKIESRCAIRREHVEGNDVLCWVECRMCGKKSEDHRLSYAALHVPFGKYLEILVYSDRVLQPTMPICSHIVPPVPEMSSAFSNVGQKSSPNLLRQFKHQNVLITISLSSLNVYETSLSKLVPKSKTVKANTRRDGSPGSSEDTERKRARLKRKRLVKREVEGFYEILEERIDMLKERLSFVMKNRTQTSQVLDVVDDPAHHYSKLHKLLMDICTEKDSLLVSIHESSLKSGGLNDVRRTFMQKSRSAAQKLTAWEETDGSGFDLGNLPPMDLTLRSPKYFLDKDAHALPGSSVLYKEDQPASLIAHALSSTKYLEELSKSQSISIGPSLEISAPRASMITSSEFSISPSEMKTDHVLPNSCFAPPHCTANLTRADHAKDFSAALFSLRRKRSDSLLSVPSAFSSTPQDGRSSHAFGTQKSGNDPTISFEEAEGRMCLTSRGPLSSSVKSDEKNPDEVLLDVQKLHRLLEDKGSSIPTSISQSTSASSLDSGSVTPSLSVPVSPASHHFLPKRFSEVSHTPNGSSVIPEETPLTLSINLNRRNFSQSANSTPLPTPPLSATFGYKGEGWTSSLTSALGDSVSAILQYGPNNTRRKPSMKNLSSSRTPSMHNLLGSEAQLPVFPIESKPHVHLTTTIGSGTNKRREITCIIYYAAAFETLRRRLGIDVSIIESLENTNLWDAQGGKSKAAFFKTTDDKFVVKELVSKWNISDIQGLLDIAPAYFDFILSSGSAKPTSLAKIVGFYTCKVHDLDTNQTRKLDLLVMENLFYDQTISKTFDLKGIEGRRFKNVLDGNSQLTLGHDMDWVEGLKAVPLLIHPYGKSILHDAILNDTKFLSTNFVMDYSLLVGIDEIRKELAVGVVDAIGAFTLFKALESKGKQLTRKDGSDITVIPPDQYRARFEHAMESYFLVCPDRFSLLGSGSGLAVRPIERVYPVVF